MPLKIGDSIARALRDNRVSINEVSSLISEAKSQPLTADTKAQLQALLSQHADKFGSVAARDLRTFLGSATVALPPAPPAPPAPATPRSIADPTVLTKHTTDTTWKPVQGGKLFVDGVNFDDVVQGSIANCYMVGAFSAVARANPEVIKNAIKENADGTYTVRFFERSVSGIMKPIEVTVDGDLPQSGVGNARYGKAREGSELWVGVLEKAYAQWKGNYETIGNGGSPGAVVTALTGRSTSYSSNKYTDANVLFTNIKNGATNNKPMTAPTHGKESGVDYTGTGVYAWHVYTVLGAVEDAGTKYVELRNPWGSTEPGSDGKNDGIFKMKLDDFAKLYAGVDIGN